MILKSVYPESANPTSQYCKYFFRGEQSGGEVDNLVPLKAQALKNATFLDATLWANPGYMTVGGAAANYCTLAAATHDLSLASDSLVVTARIKKVAAAYPVAEQYYASSYNPGSTTGGIILSCKTDGSAKMYVNTASGVTVGVTSAAATLTNGATANERSLVFIFPRNTGVSAYVGVDGIESASAPATAVAGLSLAGGNALRVGGPQSGAAVDAYQVAALAAYQVPLDLASLNRPLIYDWVFRNPGVPIPDWVFA